MESEKVDELGNARTRLVKAIQAQRVEPMQLAIGAYINSTLQAARVSAIAEFVVTETNGTWTPGERMDALMVKHLTIVAEQLEANAAPKIVTPGIARVNGH